MKYRIVFSIFLLIQLLLPILTAMAAPEYLSTSVHPENGTTNDLFEFKVVIVGPAAEETPLLGGGDDFDLDFRGQSRKSTFTNGNLSSSATYIYELRPRRAGKLKTPSVEIHYAGRLVTASPISVDVELAPAPSASPATRPRHEEKKSVAGLYAEHNLSDEEIYVGQQLRSVATLYTKFSIVDRRFSPPTNDGFWQHLSDATRVSRRVYQNQAVNITKRLNTLFPLKQGTHQISAGEAKVRYFTRQSSGRDFSSRFGGQLFGQLFGGIEKDSTISFPLQEVKVKPLPAAPADLPLSGMLIPLVGKTSVIASVDSTNMKTGDGITLTVVVESEGNLNSLNEIEFQLPETFRSYSESDQLDTRVVNGKVVFRKRFNTTLVADYPGSFDLEPFRIGYFDLKSEKYKVARANIPTLVVSGPPLNQQLTPVRPAGDKTETASRGPGAPFWWELLSLNLLIVILIGCTALLLLSYWWSQLRPALVRSREQGILRASVRRASSIEELNSSFRRYLTRRLAKLKPESSRLNQRFAIRKYVEDRDLKYALLKLLDQLDAARYSGLEEQQVDIEGLKKEARRIVDKW